MSVSEAMLLESAECFKERSTITDSRLANRERIPDPTSDLCQSCQMVDLEGIFRQDLVQYDHISPPMQQFHAYPLDLGILESRGTSGCPMCCWIRSCVGHGQHRWHLWACAVLPRHDPFEFEYLSLKPEGHQEKPRYLMNRSDIGPRLIQGWSKSKEGIPRMGANILTRTRLEYGTIHSMLRICLAYCSTSDISRRSLPRMMKLIDCRTRGAVPYSSDMSYAALSYVWGEVKTNMEEDKILAQTGRLPSQQQMPQTVVDAMQLVLEVGFRYLWVDRYCIRQFHAPEEKASQLPAMGHIFSAATFTIIALGDDAASGLCGVSHDFTPQISVRSRGNTYISSGLPLQTHMQNSRWYARAWCYQEVVLSTLYLILTSEQAFFMCKDGVMSETLPAEGMRQWEPWRWTDAYLDFNQDRLIGGTGGIGWSGMKDDLLNEYRSKQLTNGSDRLDALRGLLSRLDYYSFHGLPLEDLCVDEKIRGWRFTQCAKALLWRMSGGSERRRDPNFPSWTWAAISGGAIRLDIGEESACFSALVKARLKNSEVVALASLTQGDGDLYKALESNGNRILSEVTRTLCLTSYTFDMGLLGNGGACGCNKGLQEEPAQIMAAECDEHRLWQKCIVFDTQHDLSDALKKKYKGLKAVLLLERAADVVRRLRDLGKVVYNGDLPYTTSKRGPAGLKTHWLLVKDNGLSPATRVGVIEGNICSLRSGMLTKETIDVE